MNFLDRVYKNPQIPNFTKIRPVGAELSPADGETDGRTDMTKLIVAFRNFANALITYYEYKLHIHRIVRQLMWRLCYFHKISRHRHVAITDCRKANIPTQWFFYNTVKFIRDSKVRRRKHRPTAPRTRTQTE